MSPSQILQNRLAQIREQIGHAQLVAVTKYSEHADLDLAYSCGLRDFGENRVEALEQKVAWAKEHKLHSLRWHFIGHLQSNKLSKLLSLEDLYAIHSVDRLSLLKKILQAKPHRPIEIYLQVKTSFEAQKTGFDPLSEDFEEALNLLQNENHHYLFRGLMTMAPIRVDDVSDSAKKCFSLLQALRDKIQPQYKQDLGLSMGMSGDYLEAIHHGSSVVRLGSVLFDGLS